MSPHLGTERSTGLQLYASALYAPSQEMVDHYVIQMGPRQKDYLAKYEKHELFRAYSSIEDPVITSQGGESSMNAGLTNNIRNVEPLAMLENIVGSQFVKFERMKAAALACTNPRSTAHRENYRGLIEKGKRYVGVEPVEGADQMQWLVRSLTNPATRRRVIMPTTAQTMPSCCAYSSNNSGFPCLRRHCSHPTCTSASPSGTWPRLGKFFSETSSTTCRTKETSTRSFTRPRRMSSVGRR